MPSGSSKSFTKFSDKSGGRPKKSLELCSKGQCQNSATHLVVAGDPREGTAGMDSAALCPGCSAEVSSAARSDGNRVHVVPLDKKSLALHRRLQDMTPAVAPTGEETTPIAVAQAHFLRQAINGRLPMEDVTVGREPAPTRGRPVEFSKSAEIRHQQTVKRRRTPAQGEALVNESLREIEQGTFVPVPPVEGSEGGRTYGDFINSVMQRGNQSRIRPKSDEKPYIFGDKTV